MRNTRKFRPLTEYEQAVLARLLEESFEGRDELERQLARAAAREIAGPGDHAGSIEFRVQGGPRAPVRWSVPVEARGHDVDGVEVNFLLHIRDGMLDTLEVVKADASSITRIPGAETLAVVRLTYSQS